MKYKDIQLLSPEESADKLKEDIDYLIKLKFAHAVTSIENPMKIRQMRRRIAMWKTAQNAYKRRLSSET